MGNVKLFAFGSMSEGMVHYRQLEKFVKSVKSASLKGAVYRLEVGYPVLVEGDSSQVDGSLFELSGGEMLMKLLDEFHGVNQMNPLKGLHYRSTMECQADSGVEECYVYYFNPKKLSKYAQLISDGDWKRSLQEVPALTTTVSERQKEYIKRLGSSRGREIVPIDMQLYRQLMGMELIVDKGRRLALSNLGKEVYRYLD